MTGERCRAVTRTRQEDLAAAPAPGWLRGSGGKLIPCSLGPLGAAVAALRFPGAAVGTLRPLKGPSAPMVSPGEHRALYGRAPESWCCSGDRPAAHRTGCHLQQHQHLQERAGCLQVPPANPPSQGTAGTVINSLFLCMQSGRWATLQQGFQSTQTYCIC